MNTGGMRAFDSPRTSSTAQICSRLAGHRLHRLPQTSASLLHCNASADMPYNITEYHESYRACNTISVIKVLPTERWKRNGLPNYFQASTLDLVRRGLSPISSKPPFLFAPIDSSVVFTQPMCFHMLSAY